MKEAIVMGNTDAMVANEAPLAIVNWEEVPSRPDGVGLCGHQVLAMHDWDVPIENSPNCSEG